MMTTPHRFVVCALLAACSQALHLTPQNFDKQIFEHEERVTLVSFVTGWSDGWQSIEPDWEKLEHRYKEHPTVALAVVVCEDETMEPTRVIYCYGGLA